MQVYTKIIYRTLVITVGFLILPMLLYATSYAAFSDGFFSNNLYGRDAYGRNAYGKSRLILQTPSTGTANKSKPGSLTPKNSSTLNNIIQTIVKPAIVITDKYQRILSRLDIVKQRIIPMILWYLLAIMALVLMLEAYIKRRESQSLAKTVAHLKSTAQEQKNFSRLVLHNLNTPLAMIKNLFEILATNANETKATQQLKEPTQSLTSTIVLATQVASEDGDLASQSEKLPKSNISLGSIFHKKYFFIPIVLATIFGLFTGIALYRLGTGRSTTYIIFQAMTSIVVVLIFGNALRIFAISRFQHQTLKTLSKSIKILNLKRGRVLNTLNSNLGNAVDKLKTGGKTIQDTKVAAMFNDSLNKLSELSYKVRAAEEPLSEKVEKCDVSKIISDLVAEYKPIIDKKQLQLNTDYHLDKTVVTHLPELQLMIDTLLKNALDHSKEGGTISITAKIVRSKLNLQIKDNGTGMSQQAQAELFKPFSSTEDVITAEQQNLGLSLYVCKNVATRLGGDIDIDSALGKGTTAGIVIPLGA